MAHFEKTNYMEKLETPKARKVFDCIVIGKGPAGISASLYLQRAGVDMINIAFGNGALEKADKIQNYYGTQPLVSGMELLKNGENQAIALGIEMKYEEVVNIQWLDNFVVTTTLNKYEAKTLLLATGSSRKIPKIEGLESFVGHGVSFCAVCDAFFYKGKRVAVIGEGQYAAHEVEALRIAAERIVFTNGKTPTVMFEDAGIVTKKIKAIGGEEKVSFVELEDGEKVRVDGVFVALGQASSVEFAKKLGIFVEDNHLIVDKNMMSSVPGVFCAGDCVGGLLQISKAVSDGAIAATNLIKYLKSVDEQKE